MALVTGVLEKYAKDARMMFRALNGVFLIYKPPFMHYNNMRETLVQNLCRDLNNLEVRPPTKYVEIQGDTTKEMTVHVRDSYADNILVVGPRYQMTDFRISVTKITTNETSGLVVCGVNRGNRLIHELKQCKWPRSYKLKGLLGRATDDFFHTGRVLEKTTYNHIRRGHIDKICSSMQSSHQKKMFELCGVDIQSQAAYNLAVQGPLRPVDANVPMVYSIKCVDFSPPEFTLEIVCVNADPMYLKSIVHEMGLELRSTATCRQLYCVQDGLFTVNDALLPKYWTLENIVKSIKKCRDILKKNRQVFHQTSPTMMDPVDSTEEEKSDDKKLLIA